MAYPTALDSFPNAATLASEDLDTGPHSTLHGNLGAAIAALEAKVGVDGSAVTTSLDYKLAHLSTGNISGLGALATLSTVPVANGGTGQTTQQAALDTIAGTVTNNRVLAGDGTHVTLRALVAADIPTIAESQVTNLVSDLAAKYTRLVPTAVKTSAYTAAPGDLVPADTQTTGAFTVTLPNAPADGSVVSVALVKQTSTNAVTVACQGSDVIDVAAGVTTATISLLFQTETFQYKASSAIWYRISGRFPRTQLYSSFSGDATVNSSGVITLASTVALLSGRSGGQTFSGGTGTTDTLTFAATANASPATGSDIIFNAGTTQLLRMRKSGWIYVGPVAAGYPQYEVQAPGIEFNNNGTGAVYSSNSGLGASFVGTEASPGSGATINLRNSRTSVTSPTALTSGDVIGGLRVGSIGSGFGNDCGQIYFKATETHSVSAAGTKVDFYTTPNGSLTKTIAFTLNQDQSATFTNNVTLAGTVSGSTNLLDLSLNASSTVNVVTAAFKQLGVRGYGGAVNFIGQRINGTPGSPTAVTSGQDIFAFIGSGGFDTSGIVANTGQLKFTATETWANSGVSGTVGSAGTKVTLWTVPNGSTTQTQALVIDQDQSVKSISPTGGLGYGTGAGGTVTQITSRTTGVTINKVAGAITLVSAAGSATPATFTVTNSTIAATDVVDIVQKSGTDKYEIFVTNVAAGSFAVTFFTTGGTTTEQPVFNFAVIKAVTA